MKKRSLKVITILLTIISIIIIVNSCNDDTQVPKVITKEISEITKDGATCGGTIDSDGGASVTARGVCWNTSKNPTINHYKSVDGNGNGNFTSKLTGLMTHTTYFVRAYATNVNGTTYGTEMQFTTLSANTVMDVDGNIYQTITIGTQIWMDQNLKTTKYQNGDPIPKVEDNTQWNNLTTGAYCNYNNDETNANIYGHLYNLATATDIRQVCPSGWHVPTDSEWSDLMLFLGGDNVAGGKLKEVGSIHWNLPNTGATNEYGFTALPGGHRDYFGIYKEMGDYCHFWSSTNDEATSAWSYRMGYSYRNMGRSSSYWMNGYSIRCIKD